MAIFEELNQADSEIKNAFNYESNFFRSMDGSNDPNITEYELEYECITKKLSEVKIAEESEITKLTNYEDLINEEIEDRIMAVNSTL